MPPLKNSGRNSGAANLKPFRSGQSGNPAGRPKGQSLTALLRRKLDEPTPGVVDEFTGKTSAEAIAEKLVEMALAGNIRAIREILDRTEGKVTTRVSATIEGESGVHQALAIILVALEPYPEAKLAAARALQVAMLEGPEPDGEALIPVTQRSAAH